MSNSVFQRAREKAQSLGYATLAQYVNTDLGWRIFRRNQLKNFCFCCNDRSWKLELHHICYDRLGSEWPSDVCTICPYCHKRITQMILDGVAQLADAHIKLREQFEEAEQQRLFAFMRDDEAA